jgi:hypothetical protein
LFAGVSLIIPDDVSEPIDFFFWFKLGPEEEINIGSETSSEIVKLTQANNPKTKFYLQDMAKGSDQECMGY